MLKIAVLKDELVDGQRRAAGKKIRQLRVVAVDKFNVVVAEGSGSVQGKSFPANFSQLSRLLEPDEVEIATPQLRKLFSKIFDCDLGEQSMVEMDESLKLGARGRGGELKLYEMLKASGLFDEDGDEDGGE